MKNLFIKFLSYLTGIDFKQFDKSNDSTQISHGYNELGDNYLFDFQNYASQYNGNFANGVVPMASSSEDFKSQNHKIKVKPIDVLEELETVPNPFSLTLLDEKIGMLRDKAVLITQSYAKREVLALVERLENRRKYHDFKSFFDQFQNTTDEKIEILLSKYDLVMKTSDIFVPEFPDEAISVMNLYTENLDGVCSKKPVFYVIAPPDKFEEKYKKRDPILLAQSPFGFYWQILGAWDEEMLLLSEL